MSISFTNTFCLVLFFLFCCVASGQNDFRVFSEPEISINHGISSRYKINFSIGSRQFVYADQEYQFKNRQLEVSHFSTYVINGANSLSFGVKYRNRAWFEDSSNEFRLTQQYNFLHASSSLRFGHRFRNEQRFYEDETVFRLRYRFALDVPLNGFQLDVGEAYFVASNEWLYSLSSQEQPLLDTRLNSSIGWLLNKATKFQVGLQYRFENLNVTIEQQLFVLSALVFKI